MSNRPSSPPCQPPTRRQRMVIHSSSDADEDSSQSPVPSQRAGKSKVAATVSHDRTGASPPTKLPSSSDLSNVPQIPGVPNASFDGDEESATRDGDASISSLGGTAKEWSTPMDAARIRYVAMKTVVRHRSSVVAAARAYLPSMGQGSSSMPASSSIAGSSDIEDSDASDIEDADSARLDPVEYERRASIWKAKMVELNSFAVSKMDLESDMPTLEHRMTMDQVQLLGIDNDPKSGCCRWLCHTPEEGWFDFLGSYVEFDAQVTGRKPRISWGDLMPALTQGPSSLLLHKKRSESVAGSLALQAFKACPRTAGPPQLQAAFVLSAIQWLRDQKRVVPQSEEMAFAVAHKAAKGASFVWHVGEETIARHERYANAHRLVHKSITMPTHGFMTAGWSCGGMYKMHLSVSTVQRAFEATALPDSAQAAVDDLERFGLTVSIDEQGLAALEDSYGDEIWPAAWVLARVGIVAFEYIDSVHMNSPTIEDPKVFGSTVKDSKRTQRAVDAKAVARGKVDEVMAKWRDSSAKWVDASTTNKQTRGRVTTKTLASKGSDGVVTTVSILGHRFTKTSPNAAAAEEFKLRYQALAANPSYAGYSDYTVFMLAGLEPPSTLVRNFLASVEASASLAVDAFKAGMDGTYIAMLQRARQKACPTPGLRCLRGQHLCFGPTNAYLESIHSFSEASHPHGRSLVSCEALITPTHCSIGHAEVYARRYWSPVHLPAKLCRFIDAHDITAEWILSTNLPQAFTVWPLRVDTRPMEQYLATGQPSLAPAVALRRYGVMKAAHSHPNHPLDTHTVLPAAVQDQWDRLDACHMMMPSIDKCFHTIWCEGKVVQHNRNNLQVLNAHLQYAKGTSLPFTAQLIVAAIGLTHDASVLSDEPVVEETAAWIKAQLASPSCEELTRLVRRGRVRGADTRLAMDEDWSKCGATAKPYPVISTEPAAQSSPIVDNTPCEHCRLEHEGNQRLDEIVTDDCDVEQSGEALEADADSSDEEGRREDDNSRPLPLEVCRWISGVGSDGVEALCRAVIELAGASVESFTWHKGLPVTVIGPLGLKTTLQFFEAKHRRRIEGCDWTRRPTEPPPAPVKTEDSFRHLGRYDKTSAVTLFLNTLYQLALQRAGEPVAPAKRGWRDPLTGIFLSEAELTRSHVPGGVLKTSWGHAVHGWFMVDGFSSEMPTDISQFDPTAINTTLELWASNKWRKAYRSLRLGIMEQRTFLLAFLRRHGKVPQPLIDRLQESWDSGALPTLPTMSHELNVLWGTEQAIVWRRFFGDREPAAIPSPEASGFKIACPTTMEELTSLFASLVRIDLRTLPPVDSTWLSKIDRVRRS